MSTEEQKKALTRKRAEVILKVQTGLITAKEGAKELGVSRKTYYQWEKRALEAMMNGLENGSSGRPPARKEDPEKAELLKKNRELEQKLHVAEQTAVVRDMVRAFEEKQARDSKKK